MATVDSSKFSGFPDTSFDAYQERKWSSNRFNLERMRAREVLESLVRPLVRREPVEATGLALASTQDHPTIFNHRRVDSQLAYLLRDAKARKRLHLIIDREHPLHRQIEDAAEHHSHAILAFELDFDGLEVFFGIHRNAWLDARNLVEKLTRDDHGADFLELVRGLPESLRLSIGEQATPVSDVEATHLDALATLQPDGQDAWFRVGARFSRDDEQLAGAAFTETAASLLDALLPVYAFAAWSSDNDFLSMASQLTAEKKEREVRKANPRAIEEKCEVRVTSGLFSGRTGTVVEMDPRGTAKVLLGALTVKVQLRDLQRLDQAASR